VSAKVWHDERFDVFHESHKAQDKASVLTGGLERRGTLVYSITQQIVAHDRSGTLI
jgi:hypothetical protein